MNWSRRYPGQRRRGEIHDDGGVRHGADPGFTLLHFATPREAGATSGSRDKGLHGKLKAGVCYPCSTQYHYPAISGGGRRASAAVAGRDRKVANVPFAIQAIAAGGTADTTGDGDINERRRVYLGSLGCRKDKLDEMEGVQFKSLTHHRLSFADV